MKILRKKKKENGITLVALVITIIILLILAGISIAQLTGNGLFEKAKLAKEKYLSAEVQEHIKTIIYEKNILKQGEATLQDVVDALDEDEKYEYEIILGEEATIKGGKTTVGNAKSIIVVYQNFKYSITSDLRVVALDVGGTIDETDREDDTGSNMTNSKVISSLTCTPVQIGSKITVTLNPSFAEGKSSEDVYEYILMVNGKTYLTTTKLEDVFITPIEPNKTYKIYVICIDTDGGIIIGQTSEITTSNLTYVRQLAEYPVLTSSGVCNIVYKCEQGSQYDFYEYDESAGQPTSEEAIEKEGYDGNLETSAVTALNVNKYMYIADDVVGKTVRIFYSGSNQLFTATSTFEIDTIVGDWGASYSSGHYSDIVINSTSRYIVIRGFKAAMSMEDIKILD